MIYRVDFKMQHPHTGSKVVGRGSGDVGEMAAAVSEETVQWGLLRFTFGSGTFKRVKVTTSGHYWL